MKSDIDEKRDTLWFLVPLPIIISTIPNHVAHKFITLVSSHASLQKAVFLNIEGLVRASSALDEVVAFNLVFWRRREGR